MGSRVVVASLLLPFAAASPAVEAQYFRPGPFGGAFRGAPSQAGGGVLPNVFSPYAYPGYRPDPGAGANAAIATYRTLCVRLCDGFYFPISFATPEGGLARDAEQCRASCGVEARLFYHLNPGGSVESMMDLTGRAYSALPTAFKYRQTLVAGCLCRPLPVSAAAGALVRAGVSRRGASGLPRSPRHRSLADSMPCRRYSDRRRSFATSISRRWARPRAGGSRSQRSRMRPMGSTEPAASGSDAIHRLGEFQIESG